MMKIEAIPRYGPWALASNGSSERFIGAVKNCHISSCVTLLGLFRKIVTSIPKSAMMPL
jgi:hypothetical protein